jgi:hypothetical protein
MASTEMIGTTSASIIACDTRRQEVDPLAPVLSMERTLP